MPSSVFRSKRHDTAFSPAPTFTPPTGVTWNLQSSGVTATFIARLRGAPTPKVQSLATVTGPWSCRYDPVPADVDTIGSYDVEVEVLLPNGKKATLPNVDMDEDGSLIWRIGADYDNA